ncbi:MAG TPA: hypothetical protein VF607_13780 [Verrucomicrobiae bacterium]
MAEDVVFMAWPGPTFPKSLPVGEGWQPDQIQAAAHSVPNNKMDELIFMTSGNLLAIDSDANCDPSAKPLPACLLVPGVTITRSSNLPAAGRLVF